MKKIFLLVILITYSSYAQFSFGPKIGLLNSSVRAGKDFVYNKIDSKTSYYIGGFTEYKFSKIALNFEVNYSDEGFKINNDIRDSFDSPSYNTDLNINISSLKFYLNTKYYFTEKFSAKIGGFYSSVLSVKEKHENSNNQTIINDYSKIYSKYDYGLTLGAEYFVYKNIFIEARYNHGFAEINYNKEWANQFSSSSIRSGDYSLKSRIFNIGIGYKF